MSRYLIIGCSGSGKSTLARNISSICSIPYYDTDALYWGRNWKLRTDEEVIKDLPLNSGSWVIDGSFIDFRKQVWCHADHIIWLNMPPLLVLWRVVKRNLSWCFIQPSPWTGKKMPLKIAVSGIRHSASQLFRHSHILPAHLDDFHDKKIDVIKSKQELKLWFEKLTSLNNHKI